MNTKFGTNVFNRMLLNAAKSQGYSFYRFGVIKGKPTGGGGVKLSCPQIRVKCFVLAFSRFLIKYSYFGSLKSFAYK